ncbi:MAG: tetratricopeptide repeat protein, partial [Elusimicrobiota bacterium]
MKSIHGFGCLVVLVAVLQAGTVRAAAPAEKAAAKWAEAVVLEKKAFSPATNAAIVKLMEEASVIARGSGDKRLLAEALEKLGTAYFGKLTQSGKAVAAQEEALGLYRGLKDADGTFRLLRALAGASARNEKWDKVIAYDEEAFVLRVAALTLDERDTIHSQVANAYSKKGDFRRAIAAYEGSLRIRQGAGKVKEAAEARRAIAGELVRLGDYRAAIPIYEELGDAAALGQVYEDLGDYSKAIRYHEKLPKLESLGRLARVYRQLGQYKRAMDAYGALYQASQEGGAKTAYAANQPWILRDIGLVYADLGDYVQTIRYYEMAAKQAAGSWNGKATAQAYADLGAVYLDMGDLAKAVTYHEKALKASRIMEVPTREVELSLADVHLAKGDLAKAQAEYVRLDDSLRLGRLHLARKQYVHAVPSFERALKEGERTRQAKMLFAANVGLGHAHSGLRDLQKAAAHFRRALDLSEEQREALSPVEKQTFFSAKVMGFDRTEPYEGLVRCLAGGGDADGAFFWSENLKARLLAEAIARGKAGAGFTLPPDLTSRQEALETRIRGLRAEMDALFRADDRTGLAAREAELKEARAEFEGFVSELRKSSPEYAATRFPNPLKAADVALRPEERLLSFEVTAEKTFLFAIDGADRKVSVREIPLGRAALEGLALKYRDSFEGISSASDLAGYKVSVSKKLYDVLFGSTLAAPGVAGAAVPPPPGRERGLAALPSAASVIIVPDESLGLVPFESLAAGLPKQEKLGEGEHGPFPLGVTYLGDLFPVGYAQSATSLTLLRSLAKTGAQGEGALAVVDPVFSPKDSRVAGTAAAKGDSEGLQLMGSVREWGRMGVVGARARKALAGKPGAA